MKTVVLRIPAGSCLGGGSNPIREKSPGCGERSIWPALMCSTMRLWTLPRCLADGAYRLFNAWSFNSYTLAVIGLLCHMGFILALYIWRIRASQTYQGTAKAILPPMDLVPPEDVAISGVFARVVGSTLQTNVSLCYDYILSIACHARGRNMVHYLFISILTSYPSRTTISAEQDEVERCSHLPDLQP